MRRTGTIMLILLVGAAVLGGGFFVARLNSRRAVQRPEDRSGTVKDRVAKARSSGQRSLVLPGEIVDYGGTNIKLDEALSAYELVTAQQMDQKSVLADESRIVTWHKFRTLERLSENKTICTSCVGSERPPSDFVPLNEGEFLVMRPAGTMNVDGVEVTVSEDGTFPAFKQEAKYLFLMARNHLGELVLPLGPHGIFQIIDEDNLNPFSNGENAVKRELRQRSLTSVAKIKRHLKQKVR